MPVVQSWIVNRVTTYLSDELNTTVSIKGVDIEFFKKIVLEDIYIEDLQHDTLLFAPKLKVDIRRFNFKKQQLVISSAELENAHIELIRYKDISGLNFEFLADYFSPSEKDTTPSAPWEVKLRNVKLKNTTFSYRDLRWNDTTTCIDWEDVAVKNLNADLGDFRVEDDTLLFSINQISCTEKSGFRVDHFSADVKAATHYFDFKKVSIQSPLSDVKGSIDFTFSDWSDFDDYIHKVRMKSSFQKSRLASEDLKYFASELIGLHKTINFSGDIKGTVDRLKAKNLEIIHTSQSSFKGDVVLNGLPNIEESYIELDVKELKLNKRDLESIPSFPFDSGGKISIPSNLEYLGTLNFKGKFSGFYNDFVAYGNATTDLGYFSSDINLKIGDGKTPAQYSGHLSTMRFNIGKLLRLDKDIGILTAKVEVKGSGLSIERINTKLEGNIIELQALGYTYQNIKVKGDMSKKLFNGSIIAKDKNADFDFNGQIDYKGKLPVFDFVANINKANLAVLNLLGRDSSSSLSTHAELHCVGNSIDNLIGSLNFSNTNYIEYPRGITLNNLALTSSENNNERKIVLESDFANATMTGNFNLSQIFQSTAFIINQYVPAINYKGSIQNNNQTFVYHIDLKETRGVLDVLLPELSITANSSIDGHFNTTRADFSTSMKSDEVSFSGIRFTDVEISCKTASDQLIVFAKQDAIQINDSLTYYNVFLNGSANRDSANFNLLVANKDSSISKLNTDFKLYFLRQGLTAIKFNPIEMIVDGHIWELDKSNTITIDGSTVMFDKFNFKSGIQSVDINGKIAPDIKDKLSFDFSQFDISILNEILKSYSIQLGGIMDGEASLSAVYNRPVFNSNVKVKQLSFYNDTLGDAQV